jgi:hypothetical protein
LEFNALLDLHVSKNLERIKESWSLRFQIWLSICPPSDFWVIPARGMSLLSSGLSTSLSFREILRDCPQLVSDTQLPSGQKDGKASENGWYEAPPSHLTRPPLPPASPAVVGDHTPPLKSPTKSRRLAMKSHPKKIIKVQQACDQKKIAK